MTPADGNILLRLRRRAEATALRRLEEARAEARAAAARHDAAQWAVRTAEGRLARASRDAERGLLRQRVTGSELADREVRLARLVEAIEAAEEEAACLRAELDAATAEVDRRAADLALRRGKAERWQVLVDETRTRTQAAAGIVAVLEEEDQVAEMAVLRWNRGRSRW